MAGRNIDMAEVIWKHMNASLPYYYYLTQQGIINSGFMILQGCAKESSLFLFLITLVNRNTAVTCYYEHISYIWEYP